MSISREISRALHTQDPQTLHWTSSLRSPRADTGRSRSSRSRARSRSGTYLTDVGRSPSPTLRRSGSISSLRGSGGALNKSLTDLSGIESDYIKNLQQQVYFLELEANYLREQARKATDMHPRMTAEAERMLTKLRQMQSDVDGLTIELKRKEANLDIVHNEKDRVISKLEEEESARAREKRIMTDDIIQLKKERDLLSLDGTRKDAQLEASREERERLAAVLRSTEQKCDLLRSQLDQRTEQHKLTQLSLEEKRSELLSTETQLRDVEERYITDVAILRDKTIVDLKDEIRLLRHQLKETELRASEDRILRNKTQDESQHLVKENALLNQQILDLSRQLDRETELREATETRRSMTLGELARMKEKEKTLEFDLRKTSDTLRQEQDRAQRFMTQLTKQEDLTKSVELEAASARSRLAEAEAKSLSLDADNSALRRDKQILVDHVSDLQRKLSRREEEVQQERLKARVLDAELSAVERAKVAESVAHSQKWHEFESLADSMKSMSRSMARSTSPVGRSPRSTTRLH